MLEKPNDKQMMAIARLSGSPDFDEFMGWLDSMLSKQDKDNRTLSGSMLPQGQGIAQSLAHIVEYSGKAKEVSRKIKEFNAKSHLEPIA